MRVKIQGLTSMMAGLFGNNFLISSGTIRLLDYKNPPKTYLVKSKNFPEVSRVKRILELINPCGY